MASMAVQASSNFPSSHPIKYDVFLSFRGADTRTNFTDHLYKALQVHQGIPTFRDSEELEKGNDLSQLFEAIEKSTIAVVILSSNYASSAWCLKEVAKIVECRNKSGLIVLPVFYDIEPTQVRYQTEIFKNYFDEHEKRYKDSINSWRQALTEVADLSGWHLKDRLQTTVIQEIVECVDRILKLKFNPLFSIEDSKDFVGLDRVREIELDLDIIRGSVKVGVIGICGMPGVGKTTIAKVVSRRNWHHFDASSFIANVGEILKKNGLLHVQNQLYHDLLDSKVISMNDVPAERRKLRHKKVLIVLDGVTEFESIGELIGRGGEELMNWFGPGSIIMITTIDEKLLKRFKAKIHKVERLIVNEARLLFFRKAFNKDQPPHKFANLSNKFVDFADGLPLAIVALGNLLFERTLDEWEAELRTLEANNYTGDENLVGILKVCIDGLRGGAKEIFLDIACFFKGDDKKRAERIFESCGHNPSVNLNILLEKSLVTIVGGKLWMHDLLQDIGQKMVVGESKSLGKRSRLWRHEDAISVLMKYEGTRDVRGIFLSSPQSDEVRLKADSFSNMDFLRLLKIKNVIFSECHEYDLSNRLSLLDWHGFPSTSLPSKFKPEKLVELHLPQSQIKQLWKDIMMPPLKMLVIMDLSDCKYLTSTPHFQSVPNLESLILKGCTRLSEVYLPIGNHLQKLMLLNLEGCESLSSLPNGICILRSLTTLILSGCSKLANLPEKFGENMKQLSELDLNGTAIKELPASIKHLAGLIRLNLRDCKNLLSLLAMICSLTKLQVLNLSGCSNLDELPENLGSLVGLKELDASRSCIKQVPSSILLLKDLESLSFRGCGGLQLPASFSGLDSLTKLDLSYCKLSDGEIPADLDCLSSIDHLNLSGNSLVRVPESITKLSKLEVLLLNDCSRLRSLPHLPSSIQRVFARNCPLLGTYSNKLTVWTSTATGFCFINSQSSEERKLQRIPMTEQRLLRPHLQKFYEDIIYKGNGFEYITPHTKIPSWLDRRSEGSSITISLPPDYFVGKRELMGFALCFVYESQGHENMKSTASNFLTDEQVKYSCNYSCRMFTCGGPDDDDDCPLLVCKLMDHDYVGSFRHWVYVAGGLFADRLNKRSVRAQVLIDRPGVEVQACGASLIYSGGVTEFVWNLNHRDEIPSHMRNLLSPNDEAQMNRSISLYTRGKKFLDHDAGSSSRTGSSTQVPNQRLTRPESNDQSNEQEQGTNSQLTHVAKGGCASDTRLLIEIEPHTSRDDSITSTEMVGDQLGANVESFLDELFELGGKARSYVIGFIFSLRAILPWFTHQSIGNKFIVSEKRIGSAVVLPLPPELYNNKKWVGFALSVSFTLPPCVWHEKSCCLETFLYTSGTNLHYLRLSFDGEDNLKGSHRILVIHIPRGHFEKQLNWGSISVAEFGSSTPGVEVEMCGMRVVYEQDLKGLTQTITQCTIRNPLAVYNGHASSFVPDGNMALVTAFLNVNLIEAAESSKRRRSTLQEPLRDSKFISDQQINLTIEAGTLYTPLKNKDSVVEWKRNLQLLLECFFSFSDLSIDLFLHNSRTSFSKEFSGIFLQKEIPNWFPQLHSESMVLELPPNLENDVNFMGLVLCAAFSVNASEADVLKYLDSGHCAQLNFRFHYSIFDQSFDLIRAPEIFTSPENKFMWLYRRGFIWQQYVPRGILKDVLHKDTSVKVSCRTDSISSKVLGVQKCSFRIVYKQDVEKLKQTMMQCFTSFFDNEDIIRAYLVAQDSRYNYGTTCSSDERESCGITAVCQGQTSGKSNDPDLNEIEPLVCQSETSGTGKKFPPVDLDCLKNRLLDQGQLLDFDRFSIYNCCFPPNEIVEWFGHNSNDPSVEIPLPPNSTDWIGLALCAYFEVLDRPTSNLDSLNPGNPHHLTCYFETEIERDSPEPLHAYCTSKEEFQWLHLGGFLWLSYIPRTWFLDYQQLNKCINLKATIASDGQGLGVLKCGLRLLYQHDEQEFKETIMHCKSGLLFDYNNRKNKQPGVSEAQMNRSNSLSDTTGKNKQFLDHDAGSSSRTGSRTQVPHQRLERPESNDRSNEQEQGTDSQLTLVAEAGCASDTRLLIEIEPHTSRDDSTSTKIVGDQLGTNVESFLDELFEPGGEARSYDIGFIFSLRAILPWFTHQSIGNIFIRSEKRFGSDVVLPLPPELYNNKKWVGFAFYVSFTLPPGVRHEKYCSFQSSLHTGARNVHYLKLLFHGKENLKGSHRILVIHIPRRHFEEQSNWGPGILAQFVSPTPGVEVEMCGMRVVYEQDLKGLIQTITQCTIRSPLAVYNGLRPSIVATGKLSLLTASLNVNLMQAAEFSERRRSTLQEPLRDSKFIGGQQINLTIEAGTPYIPLKNKDSVVEWKRNLQLLFECFFSFSDLSIELTLNGGRTSFSKEFSGIFLQKEIPDWFPQLHSESMVLELPPNLENDVNFMGLVLCAAFSVNASEADVLKYLDSGHCAQLNFLFHYSIFDQSFDLIRAPEIFTSPKNEFMWLYRRGFIWQQYVPRGILKDVLHKDTSVKVSCRTDSISSKVLGVQKCSFRIVYKQDVEKLKQTIIQCFTSFVDNEDIIRAYLVAQDAGYNYGTTCSSDERESYGITPICQGETSGESNGPDLIPFFNPVCQGETSGTGKKFPQVDLENRLLDQGQLLDFDRFSIYNCCVPPNEIIEWFGHNNHGPSVEIPLPPNSTDWIGLALCAYFEVLGSSTSNLDSLNTENSHHLTCYFETETDRGSPAPLHAYRTSKEEFQWLHLGGFLWLSYIPRTWFLDYHQLNKCNNLKATIASDGQGLGVLKCGLRLLYHNDEQEFKETIMHCVETGSSGGNSIIEKTRSERLGIPIKSKGSSDVSEDERDSYGTTVVCQGETSGKSNDLNLIPFFIEIEPPASTDSSSTQIEQLRRNIESLLEQLFQGYNTRHYNYGFILSPRVGAVMPWFSHQSFGKVILITAPPDLYKDKKWVGFALYVAFTQSPDPDLFCVCSLHCSPGNRVISIIRLCPDQFSGSQRRLCFIHIPRARLPKQCNDSSILAAFDFCPPVAAVVEMCGIRVVYDEDVKGLVQTITQSTIRNQPVYFSRDDQTLVTPDGDIAAVINMATSLVAHSKDSVQPTPNTFSPPAVPSQKFGKVELQMHTWFHQKVTIEWKRNLKLLLQSFFRLDHLSIKLHLGQDAIACYEDLFAASYLFPRKEIPDWFTQKSLTSTVVTQLPDDLQSDNNWMGFVVCAAFSVHPHPTDVGNYKDSQLTSDVSCNFRWSSDSSRFFSFRGNLVRVLPNTKFMWLSCRGFIWLRFVPYDMFKIAMMDESHRQLEASFESGSPALAVQKCSLRILYKKDVEEYKQTLIQCFVSVFDNLYHSQPYTEDDFRHNKEPIHEDDQIDSFGTASLSPDTQHETNTAVPVPHGETSGNSFNRFNSILFEPILYDNRSAVIFADFRGWEEFKPMVESQPEHVLHGRPQSLGEAWMERVVQFLTNFCRWKVCW